MRGYDVSLGQPKRCAFFLWVLHKAPCSGLCRQDLLFLTGSAAVINSFEYWRTILLQDCVLRFLRH